MKAYELDTKAVSQAEQLLQSLAQQAIIDRERLLLQNHKQVKEQITARYQLIYDLRTRVRTGTYKVDSTALARKLLEAGLITV